MKIALGVEYDGSRFHGWQDQVGARTVQPLLEQALAAVADHPLRVHCAGRTDSGVHATGQVVHFESNAERSSRAWTLGANVNLPADIAVRWAQVVPDDFHARFSAVARTYRYIISNRRTRPGIWHGKVTWECFPLDHQRMAEAAGCLLGEHDFSSFQGKGCQANHPVRTISRIDVARLRDAIVITVTANAFLLHMVRNIAGTLMAVGRGWREIGWVHEVLEQRNRALAGMTARPEGLYLVKVDYPPQYALPATADGDFPFSD